jgi:dephospho-CoA kinase
MLTVIVTGGIGSGKSAVCALLRKRGIPVYDSDSRVKELYVCRRSLVPRLEKALGSPLRQADGTLDKARLAALIFSDEAARETLESIVYPILLEDFKRWRSRQKAPFVVLESAIILTKPVFDGLADAVVLVEAPDELRIQRTMHRDGTTRKEVLQRMKAQSVPEAKTGYIRLENNGGLEALSDKVNQLFFDKNGYICKLITSTHFEPEGRK